MREVNDLVQSYVESLTPTKSLHLERIASELKKDNKWGINIGAVEGRFLQFMIRSLQLKKIVEVGTQYGYSTQWMLEALPADGRIISLEKDPGHFEKAKAMVQDPRVEFLIGDAIEILPSLSSRGPFDLVFIDANKKAYPQYLDWALTSVRSGGLIIGDNTFLFGTVLKDTPPESGSPGMWKAMRSFNQNLFNHSDYFACIIPTAEGLTMAVKK